MKKQIISHPELLEESIDEMPLGFQESEIKRITQYVNQRVKTNKTNIVAYLGPYGSGKSVILNNVLKRLPDDYDKFQFDIWQCSDRKEIWEIFLINLLSRIKRKSKEKLLKSFNGEAINWPHMIIVSIILTLLGILLWLLSETYPNNTIVSFFKYFTITLSPLFLALTGIDQIIPFRQSKISNLFQYEKEIWHSLNNTRHPTIIIIEDIDRSGQAGQVFLETLKSFTYQIKKPIVIICPQKNISFGETSFEVSGEYNISALALENSIKIYDDVIYSGMTSLLSKKQIEEFLGKIGCVDIRLEKTIYLLNDVCIYFSITTMRSLKFLLRNTISFIEANPDLDPAISFFFLSYKFVNGEKSGATQSLIKTLMTPGTNHIIEDNNPETKLILQLFNINLDDYPNASIIAFGYRILNKKDFEIEQISETNIMCMINIKYKQLLNSISAR